MSERVVSEYMMRSGSVEARLSRIWGISLLPYSVEVFVAIAMIQREILEKRWARQDMPRDK